MSYCRNCGKEINDDDKFCPECGKPTGVATPVSYNAQEDSIGKDTLAEVNRMISYFSKKQAQYDEWYSCTAKLSNPIAIKRNEYFQTMKDNARRAADAAARGARSAQIAAIGSCATALFSTMTYFRGVKIRKSNPGFL